VARLLALRLSLLDLLADIAIDEELGATGVIAGGKDDREKIHLASRPIDPVENKRVSQLATTGIVDERGIEVADLERRALVDRDHDTGLGKRLESQCRAETFRSDWRTGRGELDDARGPLVALDHGDLPISDAASDSLQLSSMRVRIRQAPIPAFEHGTKLEVLRKVERE